MENDKLEKAAKREAYDNYDRSYNDRRDGFIKGAEWLMSQPLSERLTEEEREKIKGYLTSAMFVYASGSHASLEGLRDMFFDIFGKEMFENIE